MGCVGRSDPSGNSNDVHHSCVLSVSNSKRAHHDRFRKSRAEQFDRAAVRCQTLLAPKGGIFIGQAKLTFKMKDGSTKVPIGITYANRTELIKAPEVRGHVGLQFDWSA